MSKDFTPYQEALELKELEFDEPCFGYFNVTKYLGVGTFVFKECDKHTTDGYGNKVLLRPTFQQAFRWFREKYQLHSYIEGAYPWFRFYINSEDNRWEGHKHLSHEEAELECLKKLIQIVKENKQ